ARPVGAGIQGADRNRIGVYHTHSGESYLPSDGVESTDQQRGGVYQVGAQFSQRLEKNGVQVMHSQATHFPYTGSYRRSR
ncbi:stage II sporulation protein P, partial [Klebsiella variicola]|uniref:stage II sporulation protein P n=1 Tax=Klebsiella variicola TaxID=244366 RepID=UPI002730611B